MFISFYVLSIYIYFIIVFIFTRHYSELAISSFSNLSIKPITQRIISLIRFNTPISLMVGTCGHNAVKTEIRSCPLISH